MSDRVVAGHLNVAALLVLASSLKDRSGGEGGSSNGPNPLAQSPPPQHGALSINRSRAIVSLCAWFGLLLSVTAIHQSVVAAPGDPLASFGTSGHVLLHEALASTSADVWVRHLVVDLDGGILLVGELNISIAPRAFVGRLNADGSVDTTYASNGIRELDGERVGTPALHPDGGVLVPVDPFRDPRLVKLTAEGELDSEFAAGGIQTGAGGGVLALQPNASIVTTGRTALVRSTVNGNRDSEFAVPANVMPLAMAVDVDGSLVLAGEGVVSGGSVNPKQANYVRLIRLSLSGTLDPTFGTDGVSDVPLPVPYTSFTVSSLAIDSSRRILVVGENDSNCGPNSTSCVLLMRLLPDGSLDTSFGVQGLRVAAGVVLVGANLAIQPDGKILLTANGVFNADQSSEPVDIQLVLYRFDDSGDLDASFALNGAAPRVYIEDSGATFPSVPNPIAISPAGVIYAAAFWYPGQGHAAIATFLANDADNNGEPEPWDLTPDALEFANIRNALPGTLTESAMVTVSGLDPDVVVPIFAHASEVAVNDRAYSPWAWLRNGDQVTLRQRSSAAAGGSVDALSIAGGIVAANNSSRSIGVVTASFFELTTRYGPEITAGAGNFSVTENAAVGTLITTITTTNAFPDDGALNLFLIAGNTGDAFAIDQSGRITVARPLDFETLASYDLTIEARAADGLRTQAALTVNVSDIAEGGTGTGGGSNNSGGGGGGGSLDWFVLALLLGFVCASREVSSLTITLRYQVRISGIPRWVSLARRRC